MISNFKYIFIFLMVCCCQHSFSQENKEKQDSSKIYRKIEKYSQKRRFTKFLHKLVFVPVTKQEKKNNVFLKIKKINYEQLEGKIIRNIKIVTLDPFGYSEKDSTQKPSGWAMKTGNTIHRKTRIFAIKNVLLIKKNMPLDSLLVKESERLIRSQRFVRSVLINTELLSKTSDSVDVFIRVLDSWSLVPDFATSSSRSTFKITDKNFLGTGHEFANAFRQAFSPAANAYSTSYTVPNIKNSFIRTNLSYQIDLDHNYSKLIAVERPFYSTFARWAGGIYVDQQFRRVFIYDSLRTTFTRIENFKYNSQDYWAGYSFKVLKGNSEEHRTTNLITAARFLNKVYLEQPSITYDSLNFFSNEKLYLVSIGISSRKFTQDKYLFNFNVVEDVASGIIYNFTGGYQKKNNIERLYLGARFALGKYYDFGFLSGDIEYGSFFNSGKPEQTAFVFNVVYFTNLIDAGRWKYRQFIKPQVIMGYNRVASVGDKLTLDSGTGIQGFNDTRFYGTKKLLCTFQTQGYAPWNVYGFRLNPYFNYTMGMLGNSADGFKNSRLFSQIGVGAIISNDYLVFSSFQFSFSFYPSIPNLGDSVFKTNSLRTDDFRLQTFEISKPILVPYQ